MTRSLAQVVDRSAPAFAHTLSPGDGRVTAQLAALRIATNRPDVAVDLARQALKREATAIQAVVTIGLAAQARGDIRTARRWFAYAQILSRRDLQTQLWAIEDAVSRSDIPTALRHYDIALRTSKTAPNLLYPVLSSAIADPVIRTNLIATMARRPAWNSGFIAYAAEEGADPQATAQLFGGLWHKGISIPSEATAGVIKALIGKARNEEAWQYYASVHPGANPARSRDPRFAATLSTPSAFDWNPVDDGRIATSIQAGRQGGVFDFSVSSGAGGAMLHQTQVLPVGTYRMEGRSTGIQQPARSLPYWTLTCDDGRELGRIPVSSFGLPNGGFVGTFGVPSGCPSQMLTLVAQPSDDMAGVSGQIVQAQLVRVR